MPKVLVLFYSRTGNTARLADAVVEGARDVEFTEVEVRRLEDLSPASSGDAASSSAREELARRYRRFEGVESLEQYDGLILGSPAYSGSMAAELKLALDSTAPMWRSGALKDRVGGAFASAGEPHGGHETTCWGIMAALANLGMILVPPAAGQPGESKLQSARELGRRVAEVSEWVRHARGHQHGHGHTHGHGHSH